MPHSPTKNIRAELIGTFLEILIYGIYLVVFCKCLQVLRIKYREGRPTAVMACTAVAIFALVTLHLIMDILRAVHAFTTHTDTPNYAISYYTIVRRDLDLIKSSAYIVMTIISDALIGYRTFVVWARSVVLAGFLILLITADIALGTYAVYLLGATRPGDDALTGRVTERVKWFYAVTLVENLICTTLIALKIWRVQHEVDRYSPAVSALRHGGSSKRRKRPFLTKGWMPGDRLILVVVESAAVYSLLLIIMIVMSVLGAPSMLAMLDLISPIIGIVFSMVIIRVSVDRTRWESLKISTHLNFVMSSASQVRPRSRNRSGNGQIDGVRRDDVKLAMDDLESVVGGGLGLHMHPRIDDSGFDESSASMSSEKFPLPSITFEVNPSINGHGGANSLDDLTANIGQVMVAPYAYPTLGSRRGSDAGISCVEPGLAGGRAEMGSIFSASVCGENMPGTFVCAL